MEWKKECCGLDSQQDGTEPSHTTPRRTAPCQFALSLLSSRPQMLKSTEFEPLRPRQARLHSKKHSSLCTKQVKKKKKAKIWKNGPSPKFTNSKQKAHRHAHTLPRSFQIRRAPIQLETFETVRSSSNTNIRAASTAALSLLPSNSTRQGPRAFVPVPWTLFPLSACSRPECVWPVPVSTARVGRLAYPVLVGPD